MILYTRTHRHTKKEEAKNRILNDDCLVTHTLP